MIRDHFGNLVVDPPLHFQSFLGRRPIGRRHHAAERKHLHVDARSIHVLQAQPDVKHELGVPGVAVACLSAHIFRDALGGRLEMENSVAFGPGHDLAIIHMRVDIERAFAGRIGFWRHGAISILRVGRGGSDY
jgi:hypothetical protein